MVLMAAYNVLLFKYTGSQDIVVGAPTAGRIHPDLQNIIGMFVNTLALRNFPRSQDTFLQFLGKVKEKSLEALKNQDYQLERLIDALGIRRERGRNPLFDTVFVLHNFELGDLELEGMELIPYELERKQSTFDISIEGFSKNRAIRFYLEYCTRLFRRETIQKMTAHFLNILEIVAGNPSLRLADIDMATPGEKEQARRQFNTITDGGKYDFD
jgi:non-ribosomal peptide synthetase component F